MKPFTLLTVSTLIAFTGLRVAPAQVTQPSNGTAHATYPNTVTMPPMDRKATKAEAAAYHALRSQSAETLNELARKRAQKALTELRQGRQLAISSAREEAILRERLSWVSKLDQVTTMRSELRVDFETEAKRIRTQFAGDKSVCERELRAVLHAYKPRLMQLKAKENRFQTELKKTDDELAIIRQNLVGLKRDVRLAEQGLLLPTRTEPEIANTDEAVRAVLKEVGLDPDQLDIPLGQHFADTAGSTPFESPTAEMPEPQNVEEAINDLESLFE